MDARKKVERLIESLDSGEAELSQHARDFLDIIGTLDREGRLLVSEANPDDSPMVKSVLLGAISIIGAIGILCDVVRES